MRLVMKLTCLSCSHLFEVKEGDPLQGLKCPKCGVPIADHFPHAKSVRFESAENPAYARACELARRGEIEPALAALEEALRSGFDPELAGSDPALAKLRADPRWPGKRRGP